tara:strand:- start:191 stop:559 length:369 start_codon:yes stop_codon:yes gene_type:complete
VAAVENIQAVAHLLVDQVEEELSQQLVPVQEIRETLAAALVMVIMVVMAAVELLLLLALVEVRERLVVRAVLEMAQQVVLVENFLVFHLMGKVVSLLVEVEVAGMEPVIPVGLAGTVVVVLE